MVPISFTSSSLSRKLALCFTLRWSLEPEACLHLCIKCYVCRYCHTLNTFRPFPVTRFVDRDKLKSYSTELVLPQTVCYIKTLWNRHCDLNNVLRARTQKLANEIVIFVRKHSYVRALYFAEKHNGDILRSICSISIVALFQRLRPHWGSDDIWHHKIVYLLFRTI